MTEKNHSPALFPIITTSILTGIAVGSVFLGAAKLWGDSLWVDKNEAANIARTEAAALVLAHAESETAHYVSSDLRYIPRREANLIIEPILQQLARIDENQKEILKTLRARD